MKKWILELEEDWIAYIFAALGLVLIIFPEPLTDAAHYVIGVGLLLRAFAGLFAVLRFHTEEIEPGKLILYFALGAAVIYHKTDSVQLMGFVWAIMALYEVGEEIDEMIREKKASFLQVLVLTVSTVLAVLLLFSPFHHFAFHVRVLGIEMLLSVFIRHTVVLKKKKKEKSE
ncbi:MAG: hypothetical protein IJS65_00090 [Clostridia bacterium]|nr:hypothetical protein [Clostridia bacterium]